MFLTYTKFLRVDIKFLVVENALHYDGFFLVNIRNLDSWQHLKKVVSLDSEARQTEEDLFQIEGLTKSDTCQCR